MEWNDDKLRFLAAYAQRIREHIELIATQEERGHVMALALDGYCIHCWDKLRGGRPCFCTCDD